MHFHEVVNVIIGENDSGKTAIADAIRYVFRTKSGEPIYMDEKDFHSEGKVHSKTLRIEAGCMIYGTIRIIWRSLSGAMMRNTGLSGSWWRRRTWCMCTRCSTG